MKIYIMGIISILFKVYILYTFFICTMILLTEVFSRIKTFRCIFTLSSVYNIFIIFIKTPWRIIQHLTFFFILLSRFDDDKDAYIPFLQAFNDAYATAIGENDFESARILNHTIVESLLCFDIFPISFKNDNIN